MTEASGSPCAPFRSPSSAGRSEPPSGCARIAGQSGPIGSGPTHRRSKSRFRTLGLATIGTTAALAATAAAAGAPTITHLSTAQHGRSVVVKVTTRNFRIDAKDVGKSPKSKAGHEHFSMDGGKYDYPKYSGANGKLAVQLGVEGKYSPRQ